MKQSVFVIAEIGNNHNGSLKTALQLVDSAVEAGADCVKFQMRQLSNVYRSKNFPVADDLGVEYQIDLLDRFNLSNENHQLIFDYCKDNDIEYMCTPWDEQSVEILAKMGVDKFKIASADLMNFELISRVAKYSKHLVASTGMATEDEINLAIAHFETLGVDYTFLHCNSAYPAPFHDINLLWMTELRKKVKKFGYSGHERGFIPTLGAVALGSSIIERHFTFDKDWEGPDHAASLLPGEFREMVEQIRILEQSLGTKRKVVSQGELLNKENLSKSIVASTNISKGSTFELSSLSIFSPGNGLSPHRINELVGLKANRDIAAGDFLFESDLKISEVTKAEFSFSAPWGIPVRYHDFEKMTQEFECDFVEFHLSYSDLELDLNNYLTGTYEKKAVVHAPELLENSQLMDLTINDKIGHEFQLCQFRKILEVTKRIKSHFNMKNEDIMLVCNLGGFSRDKFLSETDVAKKYIKLFENLSEVDTSGIEVIPQTMAPFPWHFGGQRYQNLFMHPDDIVNKCAANSIGVCLDVSHTYLTCNFLKLDFYSVVEMLLPFVKYIHMGDARGLNGEGLQIGDGDIDFVRLFQVLEKKPVPFIPEIWQGHKNNGEGFRRALSRLQDIHDEVILSS